MSYWEAIILGIVQGLTEFLPISSSGHLVLLQQGFGLEEGVLSMDVLLHFGTLVAVVAVFWRELWRILAHPWSKLARLLLIGTLPTALMGLVFQDTFERMFATGATLGVEFVITGIVLWMAEIGPSGQKKEREMGYREAMIIGSLQGAAILPALSRSGLTIVGALWQGLEREFAARFSFLLSVPAILGATLLQVKDLWEGGGGLHIGPPELAGMLAAALSGYAAIRFMVKRIVEHSLKPFAIYVWILGAAILLDQIWTHKFFPSPF